MFFCSDKSSQDPLLRRPFSIYKFYKREEYCVFEIIYEVVGRGTENIKNKKRRRYP